MGGHIGNAGAGGPALNLLHLEDIHAILLTIDLEGEILHRILGDH